MNFREKIKFCVFTISTLLVLGGCQKTGRPEAPAPTKSEKILYPPKEYALGYLDSFLNSLGYVSDAFSRAYDPEINDTYGTLVGLKKQKIAYSKAADLLKEYKDSPYETIKLSAEAGYSAFSQLSANMSAVADLASGANINKNDFLAKMSDIQVSNNELHKIIPLVAAPALTHALIHPSTDGKKMEIILTKNEIANYQQRLKKLKKNLSPEVGGNKNASLIFSINSLIKFITEWRKTVRQ